MVEMCDTHGIEDREGEGKEGEEKRRNPEEAEKVLAKGSRLDLRRSSKSAQGLQHLGQGRSAEALWLWSAG